MSNILRLEEVFITKVSFFSESSASLHLLTADGCFRVLALSFMKRFSYTLENLVLCSFSVEIRQTEHGMYLYRLQKKNHWPIQCSKMFFLIYIRHLIDYCAKLIFEKKIYLGLYRFLTLLSQDYKQEYYYYALISFQFVLLELSGLGSASEQMKYLFENDLISIEDIHSIHAKMVSEQTFLSLQAIFEELFQQHIGYFTTEGYFYLWITLLSNKFNSQKVFG